MNTRLICGGLLSVVVVLGLTACSSQPRFQQTSTAPVMFDNKTAQDCYAFPRPPNEPRGSLMGGLHYCEDLVK